MKWILVLWILSATPLLAAEADYRVVHPDGTVEFTDQPAKGAEEIRIAEVPTYPSQLPRSPQVFSPSISQNNRPSSTQQQSGDYQAFVISSPQEKETVWFDEQGMTVSLLLVPGLAKGDEVVIRLDGKVVASGSGTSFTIKEVYRGTHTLSAAITDEQGIVIREAKPITFFMRQHSVLHPSSPLSTPATSTP
jgi:hypothetical protein